MLVHNEPIPANKINQFHEILCATGGRYIGEPIYQVNLKQYRVSYKPGNYANQSKMWKQATTSIREVDSRQWWKKVIRKIKRLAL